MHKSAYKLGLFLMASLIMLVPFANTNLFSDAMAAVEMDPYMNNDYSKEGYERYYKDNSYRENYNYPQQQQSSYNDYDYDNNNKKAYYNYNNNDNYYNDEYNKYPSKDKKYECRTGQFEGFFVSSVEFCLLKKPPSPPIPPITENNNSTLINTFNCINNNNININGANTTNPSSGAQQPQDNNGVQQQGLNGNLAAGLGQIDLNKTLVNLCIINNSNNIQTGDGNNTSQPDVCEECFTLNLSQDQVTSLLVNAGVNEINNLCDLLAGIPNGEEETENLIFLLAQVEPIVTSGQSIAILLCLDDLGLIEFPLPP